MKPYIFFLVAVAIFSCTQTKKSDEFKDPSAEVSESTPVQEEEIQNLFALETYVVQGKVNGADVQTLATSSVLIIDPTEEQIAEMEKEYGEDFPTIADDASFYQSSAISVIDSLGINKVTAEKPFAILTGEAAPVTLNLRKKGAPGWMIILFNTKKTPQIVPAIDVNREMLKTYFDLN